jgi:hypothetical protein
MHTHVFRLPRPSSGKRGRIDGMSQATHAANRGYDGFFTALCGARCPQDPDTAEVDRGAMNCRDPEAWPVDCKKCLRKMAVGGVVTSDGQHVTFTDRNEMDRFIDEEFDK